MLVNGPAFRTHHAQSAKCWAWGASRGGRARRVCQGACVLLWGVGRVQDVIAIPCVMWCGGLMHGWCMAGVVA